ncbi:MAG: GNAT family N-acetyltransferase [Acholeplasmatales bacterium]|nr:GNAT family N-acetyltransferase [Acholeplasmatales bacterium]
MEIRLAIKEELSLIHNLVQNTIKQIYKNYYPIEVVNFFCMHHSFDNIRKDLNDNKVYLLTNKDEIIGTGTILDNHITRVFVHPKHQKLGYGNLFGK